MFLWWQWPLMAKLDLRVINSQTLELVVEDSPFDVIFPSN